MMNILQRAEKDKIYINDFYLSLKLSLPAVTFCKFFTSQLMLVFVKTKLEKALSAVTKPQLQLKSLQVENASERGSSLVNIPSLNTLSWHVSLLSSK